MTEEKKLTGYPSIDKPWLKYYNSDKLKADAPYMNIYTYMRQMSQRAKDSIAISYYGVNIFFSEFYQRIDEAAKALSWLGVKPGQRVMYLMPNIPETAYLMYAGAKIGAVSDFVDPRPDSVDPTVNAGKMLSLIDSEKADFIISLDICYLAMLKPIEPQLRDRGFGTIILVSADNSLGRRGKKQYILDNIHLYGIGETLRKIKKSAQMQNAVDKAVSSSILNLVYYPEFIQAGRNTALIEHTDNADEIAVIVHTSGTSGSMPKPIPLTHDNLNSYVHQAMASGMHIESTDRFLHILPYFAAFGLAANVHGTMCARQHIIEIPEFSTAALGKMILLYRATSIIGPPSWILALMNDPVLTNADLSFLEMVVFGGDSMNPDDEITFNRFLQQHRAKCVLSKGHGMSETSGCASFAAGNHNEIGTMGIPLPFTTYALVDPDTKELLRFEDGHDYIEGELIISSRAVTPGMLDGRVIVPHREYVGLDYIFTRDIARMDRNGVLTFLSRSDRSFTRFDGYKMKSYEIEQIIMGDPQIKQCIVSPYYDEKLFGNMAVADIIVQKDGLSSRDGQIAFVQDVIQAQFIGNPNVSSRQLPTRWRFRDSFPLTSNSKINYNQLAKEPFDGTEICVEIDETNIMVSGIKVY